MKNSFLSVQMRKIYSFIILKMSKQTKKSSRNWTKAETKKQNIFLWNSGWPNKQLHADVRPKSVKKTSAKEVYDATAAEMKEAIKTEPFLSRNVACRKNKGDLVPWDIDYIDYKQNTTT